MSCTLNHLSCINDVERIIALLTDPSGEEQDIIDKGFNNSFNDDDGEEWSDECDSSEELSTNVTQPVKVEKSWLQSCKISLSPSEELLVATKENKAVFLTKKWAEQPYYEITWNGCLPQESCDIITCIKCVPLASQQRSSQGTPDWTCVIVGFISGYVRIFMPNGTQLLSQFLHDGPVVNIKLKTKQLFWSAGHGEHLEELLILYPNAIVTIDGFSLYQSLRACRNQFAKAQAHSMSVDMVEPPPLEYRKWRIAAHDKVNDVTSCGTMSQCLFDRLQTACFINGPRASVKGSAPAYNCMITTGKNPFLGVYHAIEGSNQLVLSDVALVVASKLTSAVFSRLTAARGWFGGGHPQQTSTVHNLKPNVEKGTKLSNTVCLQDALRHAERINVAPIGKLAVVTDAFNRVLLVDTLKNVVVRMWKGYRDAECGWIVVEEEKDDTDSTNFDLNKCNRRALYLVIYAPKRGVLEIYLMEHGTRVGAFNVGKGCKLLYPGYKLLGQTNYGVLNSINCNETNQCFVLQSDGVIKSIHVPFHCALSATHSVIAKDAHLLKKLTDVIDKNLKTDDKTEICKLLVNILLEIQVPNTQRQAVQNILSAPNFSAEFLKTCLNKIIKNVKALDGEDGDIEYEAGRQELLQYCHAQQLLIEMFISLQQLKDLCEGPDTILNSNECPETVLANILHVTSTEAQDLLTSINKYTTICLKDNSNHMPFITQTMDVNVAAYLTCFDVHVSDNDREVSSSSLKKSCIVIHQHLSRDTLASLGHLLFETALTGKIPVSKLTLLLETSEIPPKQIMMLLTTYTQSEQCCSILELPTLHQLHSLVASVCSMKDGPEKDSAVQVGKISSWWESIREILSQSLLIGHSLIMADVCRSVAMELTAAAQKVKAQDESDILSGGWESVTVDIEQWNLLICRLENLIELDCFVHENHSMTMLTGDESPTFRHHVHTMGGKKDVKELKHNLSSHQKTLTKSTDRISVLSVKGLLDAGYGGFSQIVADCLVRQGVPGPCLGHPKRKESKKRNRAKTFGSAEESYDNDDIPEQEENETLPILDALVSIRQTFPYSLDQDLVWAHCAWESIMVWNEDVEDVKMLSSALVHLSCIHHAILQQGLAVMMWKAVFKESIKLLLQLVEKVGKAPKDRLCKKTVSMSYAALEDFLLTAKNLLEILIEMEIFDDTKPDFKIEASWKRNTCTHRSIAEQAVDEPQCNPHMLNHFWCLVTSLLLIMLGNIKPVKPNSLFDTKGKHAFTQPLHGTPLFSTEIDDSVLKSREKFCCSVIISLIKNHITATLEDEVARGMTTELLFHLDMLLHLARSFHIDEDFVRRSIACKLYSNGLDIAAHEMAMYVDNKAEFSSQMMEVIRERLAQSLLRADGEKLSDNFSKLPTKITTWLQTIDMSKLRVTSIPLINTYHLLQYLHTNVANESKETKFIYELIEGLKLFL